MRAIIKPEVSKRWPFDLEQLLLVLTAYAPFVEELSAEHHPQHASHARTVSKTEALVHAFRESMGQHEVGRMFADCCALNVHDLAARRTVGGCMDEFDNLVFIMETLQSVGAKDRLDSVLTEVADAGSFTIWTWRILRANFPGRSIP